MGDAQEARQANGWQARTTAAGVGQCNSLIIIIIITSSPRVDLRRALGKLAG